MSVSIPVEETSGVGEARRRSAVLARAAGLGERQAADLALVVTELATNLVKHTREGGEIVLRPVGGGTGDGAVEVLSIDRGPGIADVADALRDSYSTAGSPGLGLGAIGRLAATFDVSTSVESGTVLVARVGSSVPDTVLVGAVCLPLAGEELPGDAWAMVDAGPIRRVVVADGVGHGPDAAAAAAEALRVVRANPATALEQLFPILHARLSGTRGAAIAVADLDPAGERLRYAGVGNIVGAIVDPSAAGNGAQRNLVSHAGTVGHELHRVQAFDMPWPRGATLVMHSDGARARWSLDRYPGLARRHPSVVAGVLYRDFARGTDDVTVAAFRAAG